MIKFPFLRGFKWYRKLAGGKWRIVHRSGKQTWVLRGEVRKGEKRYGKRTYDDRPWTMSPLRDFERNAPTAEPEHVPEPEQPVPSPVT